MLDKKENIHATFESDSSSFYEIMITTEMYKYYQIFPKLVMSDFAVFYSTEDMPLELKLELEMILGIPLKFEILAIDEINIRIEKEESGDYIFQ